MLRGMENNFVMSELGFWVPARRARDSEGQASSPPVEDFAEATRQPWDDRRSSSNPPAGRAGESIFRIAESGFWVPVHESRSSNGTAASGQPPTRRSSAKQDSLEDKLLQLQRYFETPIDGLTGPQALMVKVRDLRRHLSPTIDGVISAEDPDEQRAHLEKFYAAWDPEKHSRGGNPKNTGQFSKVPGAAERMRRDGFANALASANVLAGGIGSEQQKSEGGMSVILRPPTVEELNRERVRRLPNQDLIDKYLPKAIQSIIGTTDLRAALVQEAFRRSRKYLPADLREELSAFYSDEALGLYALWGIAHLFGAGEAADMAMLILMAIGLGKDLDQVMADVNAFYNMARNAKTEADLDVAAKRFAAAMTTVGRSAALLALAALLAKASRRRAKGHSVSEAAKPLTGQIHHPISTKIARELERHPTLKGKYTGRDPRFTTRAIDKEAHKGYQKWHRDLDKEVIEWLRDPKNRAATPQQFEAWLRWRYRQRDLKARFPNDF